MEETAMEKVFIEKFNKNLNISSMNRMLEIFVKIHNESFENRINKKYFSDIISNGQYEMYVLKKFFENRNLIKENSFEETVGYVIFFDTVETVDLFEICVSKKEQNKGFGRKLLTESINLLFLEENYKNRSEEERKIILEVDESNYKAIKLYEKLGFSQISLRKNYYGKNKNGKIMLKKIKG